MLRGEFVREIFRVLRGALKKKGGDPILNKFMGASGGVC